jgi:hypothetical protein
MYNYLVIYGALRSLALLILVYLWYILLSDLWLKAHSTFKFDLKTTIVFNLGSVIYVLAVMAFAKFNRRYFEETILAFLLGAPEPNGPLVPSKLKFQHRVRAQRD